MSNVRKNGFTLFELIVTLAISAILVMIALPHFHQLMAEQELKRIQYSLLSSLKIARSHALTHHSNVVICPTQNFVQCSKQNWNTGFLIFMDRDRNRQIDENEYIIYTEKTALKYGTLDWRGTLNIPSVTFNAQQGLPIGSNGSFFYCSSTVSNHRLVLNKMGITRTEFTSEC